MRDVQAVADRARVASRAAAGSAAGRVIGRRVRRVLGRARSARAAARSVRRCCRSLRHSSLRMRHASSRRPIAFRTVKDGFAPPLPVPERRQPLGRALRVLSQLLALDAPLAALRARAREHVVTQSAGVGRRLHAQSAGRSRAVPVGTGDCSRPRRRDHRRRQRPTVRADAPGHGSPPGDPLHSGRTAGPQRRTQHRRPGRDRRHHRLHG